MTEDSGLHSQQGQSTVQGSTPSSDSSRNGNNSTTGDSVNNNIEAGQWLEQKMNSVNQDSNSSENLTEVNRELEEKAVLRRSKDLQIPYVNIGKTPLNLDYLKTLTVDEAKNGRVIPFFKVGNKLRVAVEEIENENTQNVLEKLRKEGYEVEINLASRKGINEALKTYDSSEQYKKIEKIESVEEKAIKTYEKEIANLGDLAKKLDTVPAEEGLNLLNVGAMKTGASDAHFEPEEGKVVVRFRIDGVLHKVLEIKPSTFSKIGNQIMYDSKMKLNVNSVPQDGRYTFNFNENKIASRVSMIPTPFGPSFVCRFLVSGKRNLTFEELGFQREQLKRLLKCAKISQGMVLVTGPTGSGKSTTLYSILDVMNNHENKIITLEDPVEYQMSGVTQSQIDEKNGYTFSSGLRTILRQDPDIVMIGEIRDIETAETAAQAALTGHVLLSTLHTNSAIESIPRLINMGLPAFMVAPALDTIIAQRLVRKVCQNCTELAPISDSERRKFEEVMGNLKQINPGLVIEIPEKIPKVHGCESCSNTGYNGRIVVAEVVVVDNKMKELILNNSSIVDLISTARKAGLVTMREDGFLKVAQGLTTLEEVFRATNISMVSDKGKKI